MRKPTRRYKGNILIEYQITENRMSFVNSVIRNVVQALELQAYPNEIINPSMGDFIRVSYAEPKEVKVKR